jgi:hypothetical protein
MQTFIIDTPNTKRNPKAAPFTIKARDVEEAIDKIVAHMGDIWLRSEYSLRETR